MPIEYVELHCHSYYSLLDGASPPEALVDRAVALGYPALALTDHDGLYGAVRFWRAAAERDLHPIIGAEMTLDDGSHLTLLAETQEGYANLCRLISTGQLAGQKGQPRLTVEALAEYAGGLLCLSGCRKEAVTSALTDKEDKDEKRARQAAVQLRDIFNDRFWIELQRHYLQMDARLNTALIALAQWLGVELLATNDVHYAERPVSACSRPTTSRCATCRHSASSDALIPRPSSIRARSTR